MRGRHESGIACAAALLVLAGVLAACSSSDSGDGEIAEPVPSTPAACAGVARPSTSDVRQQQWAAGVDQLTAAGDGETEIWIGFSRVLTVDEAEGFVGAVQATGVFLAYEERQGTYAKSWFAPEGAPSGLAELAAQAMERALDPAQEGTPFEPTDPGVRAGAAPVLGVRVHGPAEAIIEAVRDDPCLVYSVAPGDAQGPDLTTAVEP